MKVDIYQIGSGSTYVAVEAGKPLPEEVKNAQFAQTIETNGGPRVGLDTAKLEEDIRAHGYHAFRVSVTVDAK